MLVLGIRQSLDTELLEAYSAAGAVHVLAVSGMHVGLIFSLLQFLLGSIRKNRRFVHLYFFLALLAIWFFGMVTAFSPSVLRAVVMCSVVLLGDWLGKKGNLYNSLGFTAFILLLFAPYMVMQVGFQLSFLAVLGIVFFQPKLASLFRPKTLLAQAIWNITTVSIAAQLATFPLTLYYFQQFPVYFLLANLWVIWASTLVLYVGIVFFLGSFWPLWKMFFGFALKNAVAVLNKSMFWVLHLPGSVCSTLPFEMWEIGALYLILLLFVLLIKLKEKRYLLACLVLATCFSCSRIWKSEQAMSLHRLFFYSLKKGVCIVVVKTRTAHIWCSKALVQNQSAIHFQVLAPLKSIGIHKLYFTNLPEGLFEWKYGASKILVLQNAMHGKNKKNSNSGYDIVYVAYPCVKKEDLVLFPHAKHLILQSKKCVLASENNPDAWDLSNRAFEIDLASDGKCTDRSKR
jgi:competence protein ComEC